MKNEQFKDYLGRCDEIRDILADEEPLSTAADNTRDYDPSDHCPRNSYTGRMNPRRRVIEMEYNTEARVHDRLPALKSGTSSFEALRTVQLVAAYPAGITI